MSERIMLDSWNGLNYNTYGYNYIGVWCTAGGSSRRTHRLYAAHRTYPDSWPWQKWWNWRTPKGRYSGIGKAWDLKFRLSVLQEEKHPRQARWRDDDGKITYKWHSKKWSRNYARRPDNPENNL